jgi:hypothetical protein
VGKRNRRLMSDEEGYYSWELFGADGGFGKAAPDGFTPKT